MFRRALIGTVIAMFAIGILIIMVSVIGTASADHEIGVLWRRVCNGNLVARINDNGQLVAVCRGVLEHTEEPATETPMAPTDTPIAPTDTPEPPLYSDTFPENNSLILGTCPAEVHDRYYVMGPDGNKYRSYHPVTVEVSAGEVCHFAHEHGDPPHPDARPLPFGYVAYQAGSFDMIRVHQGYKLYTHYQGNLNGFGYPELDYGNGLDIDFTVMIHQGSASRGRLTVQFHSFGFWSRDQGGNETHVFAMADTGELGPGRAVVTHVNESYEFWQFQVHVGTAWNSGDADPAITNPMNHIHGSGPCEDEECSNLELVSTSEEICGHDFDECAELLPFGTHGNKNNLWLGHIRTFHEPDWNWTNAGGDTVFCTDPYGVMVECGTPNSITQMVPAISVSNAGANILDRTPNSQGWDEHMTLPAGAPGGN